MSAITTKGGTGIFYKDWGPRNGQPIVFSHGWPLCSYDLTIPFYGFNRDGVEVNEGFFVTA